MRELLGDEPVPARERRRALRLRPADGSSPRHRASGARATLALRPNPDPTRYSPGRHRPERADPVDRRAARGGPGGRCRSSRASTCWTRRSSTGCPRAPPTACATSTCRWSRRASAPAGRAHAGRVVRFRPPLALPRRAAAAAAGPGPRPRPRGPRRRGWPRRRPGAALGGGRGARVGAAARGSSGASCGTARSSRPARAWRARSWRRAASVRAGERAEDVIVLPAGGARGRGRGRRAGGAPGRHGVGGAAVSGRRRPTSGAEAEAGARADPGVPRGAAPRGRGAGRGAAALGRRLDPALLPPAWTAARAPCSRSTPSPSSPRS